VVLIIFRIMGIMGSNRDIRIMLILGIGIMGSIDSFLVLVLFFKKVVIHKK